MKRGCILSLAAVLTAVIVLIASSAVTSFAAGDFIIRSFDVDMTVQRDDTYLITETLYVEFTSPSHGIYVTIPARTEIDRDGQKSEYYAEVTDFKMLSGQPVSSEKSRGEFKYRIGDPDKYAGTDEIYQYSYVYDTKGDHFEGADELYHNLIGTGWEARSIDSASFTVRFPEDIDMSKVGIKTGVGVDVPFEHPDDRTVTGETDEMVLGGLTIRAVLPEGYFTRQARDPVETLYIVDVLLALLALAGSVITRHYGRDPVYPDTLEFYPPEGMTAPETSYVLNEFVSRQAVIGLLFALADKGYVRIHEYAEETGSKKKTETKYEIEKLRDYDGGNEYEQVFMSGLFEEADKVEVSDLSDSFYKTADEIRDSILKKYMPLAYDKEAGRKAAMIKTAGAIGFVALMVVLVMTSSNLAGVSIFNRLLCVAVPMIMMNGGLFSLAEDVRARKSVSSYLVTFAVFAISLGITIYIGCVSGWQMLPFAVGVALSMLIFVIAGLCDKKTDYFAELKARVRGYAEFLKTAEKDQMETLAEKDPGYYYRNLAFACALGVTAVYAKRFASMASEAPDWYSSDIHSGGIGAAGMADSISRMTDSVSSSMSSSSDGSGGGSFSGGGGGGGSGGGSW